MTDSVEQQKQAVVINANYELFVLLVTLLVLVNSVLLVGFSFSPEGEIVAIITAGLWVFLAADFAVRWGRSRRRGFLKAGANLLMLVGSLPVPFLAVARLIGIARWARWLRAQEYREIGQIIVTRRAQSTLLIIVFATLVVFETGGLLVLQAEAGRPEANIRTAEDALWWGYVTVATVGYGDRYPVTTGGRLIGMLIMTFGVALYSSITGFLADWFRRPRPLRTRNERETLRRAADDPVLMLQAIRQAINDQEHAHQAAMTELMAKLDAIEKQIGR